MRQTQRTLDILLATSGKVQGDYYDALAAAIVEGLDVDYAVVASVSGGRLETLAFRGAGSVRGTFSMELAGSPFARTLEEGVFFAPTGVRELFPSDSNLVAMRGESFLGVTIPGDDAPLGVMGVIHSGPLPHYDDTLAVLRVGAARAGAELRRLRAEQARAQARNLESLGMLAGGVAHDFNNILMGILGNAQDALATGELGYASAEAIGAVVAAAETGRSVTSRILTSLGRRSLAPEIVSLGRVATGSTELNRVRARQAGVTLTLEADSSAHVSGSPAELNQLVLNLVVNAIEATQGQPGEREVKVQLESKRAANEERAPRGAYASGPLAPGNWVALSVRDTGVGMSPTALQQVFGAFFSTKRSGRGLGLSVVQGAVAAHGGVLWVTSAPGEGTTFEIFFPRVDASSYKSPRPRSIAGAVRPGQRVLVIDDNDQVLRACKRMLARLGFEAEGAHDGVEAKRRLFESEFAVLLVDLTLAGQNGIELAAGLRAERPELQTIYMSGYLSSADQERIGESPFLAKPFDLRALQAALAGR